MIVGRLPGKMALATTTVGRRILVNSTSVFFLSVVVVSVVVTVIVDVVGVNGVGAERALCIRDARDPLLCHIKVLELVCLLDEQVLEVPWHHVE